MWADPDADYDKIGKLQAELEDKIAATDAWSLERNVEIAMDALRCPPDDADVTHAVGRRAAPRRAVPAAARRARPAAARRADQPPRRRVGRLAGAVPAGLPRHRRGDHPRPLLPRQRGASGSSSSTAAAGIPFEGNYSSWLEQKQARLAREEKPNDGAPAHARPRARVGAHVAEGPPGEGQGPPGRLREAAGRGRRPPTTHRPAGDRDPAGPRLGDTVIEVDGPAQGLRRPAADRGPVVLAAARPASSASSVPTAPARPRCSRCSPAQEQPDAGSITIGDTVQLAYVDQCRDTLDPDATVYEEITGGVEHLKVGNREIHGRAYVASFNFKGTDQQKPVGDLSGGERNRVHLAKVLKSRRQRAAARRADQRPRRRHAPRARGRRSSRSPAAPS